MNAVCSPTGLTLAVNASRGSVVPAILMHAVFNSSFPILVALCRGLPTREPGLTWYVVGVMLVTVVAVGMTRDRLGYIDSSRVGGAPSSDASRCNSTSGAKRWQTLILA